MLNRDDISSAIAQNVIITHLGVRFQEDAAHKETQRLLR